MRERLKNKLKKQGGFTLMEMLIVVAIIAILIAISIPIMNTALENARKATDAANERAAKACATVAYLTDGTTGTKYYDAVNGVLTDGAPSTVYGKCKNSSHKGLYIKVVIADGGTATISWTDGDSSSTTTLDSTSLAAG